MQPIKDCEKKWPSAGIYIPIAQSQFLPEKELLNWFSGFQVSQVQLLHVALTMRLCIANEFLFNVLQDKLISVQLGSKYVTSI